ncbi:MAG: hypothetical protein HN366_11120 [Deltaproteobacteria bacterium]|jgi:hypothetical protein|nr:hypothetical protein [Deltaproteobacteria bacterium]
MDSVEKKAFNAQIFCDDCCSDAICPRASGANFENSSTGFAQTSQEILEEYRDADDKRRSNMWFMFPQLRLEFDDMVQAQQKRNDPDLLTWFRSF